MANNDRANITWKTVLRLNIHGMLRVTRGLCMARDDPFQGSVLAFPSVSSFKTFGGHAVHQLNRKMYNQFKLFNLHSGASFQVQ